MAWGLIGERFNLGLTEILEIRTNREWPAHRGVHCSAVRGIETADLELLEFGL